MYWNQKKFQEYLFARHIAGLPSVFPFADKSKASANITMLLACRSWRRVVMKCPLCVGYSGTYFHVECHFLSLRSLAGLVGGPA